MPYHHGSAPCLDVAQRKWPLTSVLLLTVGFLVTASRGAGSHRNILDSCPGRDAACLTSTFSKALESNEIADLARDVVRSYGAGESGASCHVVLHSLGVAYANSNRGDIPALGVPWQYCGSGLLHGVYESIRFEMAPTAGKNAFSRCDVEDFRSNTTLLEQCVHALGHALFYSMASLNNDVHSAAILAESYCVAGGRSSQVSLGRDYGVTCATGVYMTQRDAMLRSGWKVTPGADWERALAHCMKSRYPRACSVMFLEPILRTDPDTAGVLGSFVSWCVNGLATEGDALLSPSVSCAYFAGRALAATGPVAASGAAQGFTYELAALCSSGTFDHGVCYLGFYQSSLALGLPSSVIRERLCGLMTDSGIDCGILDRSIF